MMVPGPKAPSVPGPHTGLSAAKGELLVPSLRRLGGQRQDGEENGYSQFHRFFLPEKRHDAKSHAKKMGVDPSVIGRMAPMAACCDISLFLFKGFQVIQATGLGSEGWRIKVGPAAG